MIAVSAAGECIAEGRISTTRTALERQFRSMTPKRIAIESGTHSRWVSRLLNELGHNVIVANSRKLRLIYENRHKNDKVDAEYLARLGRLDPKLLSPIDHREEDAQQNLSQLRARDVLVRTRARLIVSVRGMVKASGYRLPGCSAESFARQARQGIPAVLTDALLPLLTTIEQINDHIRQLNRSIERIAETKYPEVKSLTQIAGVGTLTALAFVVTIGDPHRFAQSRTVGAWLGLTPGRHASGQSDPQQRITKEGDRYLRSLLVNCAHYILGPFGPECDLRRHGKAIAARGGNNAKKRAIVAVARKLAVLLHRLWVTGAVYEPLRNATLAA
jgi:transposase